MAATYARASTAAAINVAAKRSPPTHTSTDIEKGQIIDTYPRGGDGDYSFGNWPAIIYRKIPLKPNNPVLFNQGLCSGIFLSNHFVLTSKHCILSDKKKLPDNAGIFFASRPGLYKRTGEISHSFSIENIYLWQKISDKDRDVALLWLKNPVDFLIKDIPIYHGYKNEFEDRSLLFGSSRRANNRSNETASLYQISAVVINDETKDLFGGIAFHSEIHPETGWTQGGDSGGPLLVNLKDKFNYIEDDYQKIVGILSTGTSPKHEDEDEDDEYHYAEHTRLDESVLLWLGDHVGMITAPNDGDIVPEGQTKIRVEVTNAREQPIVRIQLLDLKTRNALKGPEYACSADDVATCSVARPATAGNYLIAAYREDGTYDSVVVTTKIEGTNTCLASPHSEPGCTK